MARQLVCVLTATLALHVIGAARPMCPDDPNCVCGGLLAMELSCNIDGHNVEINLLPGTYINIRCLNSTSLDYNKLPKCANKNIFRSVSFKDCPLPTTSFNKVLGNLGVSKTTALTFQNTKNLSGYFNRNHFTGLQNLTKLLLSVSELSHLPDNLFMDINTLTWLNLRSNSIYLSEELFKPLEKLETLEISHNHMTNISLNLFAHLSYLRKLSLWQSNVTWFSKDFFHGVDELEELDLSSNGLNELPSSIFQPLRKLKRLTLFSNKFSSLPQKLFNDNNELQTVIILNNNVKLKELPKSLFGGLANLRQIYIQRCGLQNVPYDVFANSPKITNISLAYNSIISFPEAIFNDQINLLELDLSHNNLNNLKPKIFSSLVRLERLDLSHNSLVKISGSTFSPLLSLMDLNMEHNNLETITSYMFSNNRQKMTISLAYNKLSFENELLENNSMTVEKKSPFAHTFNLKLLNLSHNTFRHTFEDWWINGHDMLDVRYNSIKHPWGFENCINFTNFFKKPLKAVWISHNTFECSCTDNDIINFVQDSLKTKIRDLDSLNCAFWRNGLCSTSSAVAIAILVLFTIILTIILIFYMDKDFRKEIYLNIKKFLYYFSHSKYNEKRAIVVEYAETDEEFILKEILPEIRHHLKDEIRTNSLGNSNIRENRVPVSLKDEIFTTLVMFSPNYLTTHYSHVNIKEIRGEMLKARNTIYVFVDIGPENSIHAFLMEQRDPRTTILWNDQKVWSKFLKKMSKGDRKEKNGRVKKIFKSKLDINSSFLRPPEYPDNEINNFSHMQV